MGSKNRITPYILPIMLAQKTPSQYWVEPFVGGGNVIDKIGGKRLGADVNKYVISALMDIQQFPDTLPKTNLEFTEDDYKKLRFSDEYIHKGYAGFGFSYGGKWLGGWRRDKIGKRDYVAETYRNAMQQSKFLAGVELIVADYRELVIPEKSLIYCDPPYNGTAKYANEFNHSIFWDWCRNMVEKGHTVFISEYTAPKDFQCLWEKRIVSSLTADTGGKVGCERLFIHESQRN